MKNVYFVDGICAKPGLVAIAAYLEEFARTDAEHTRMYSFNAETGRWGHVELKHAIVSIAHTELDGANQWHCLSKRGAVLTVSKGNHTQRVIDDAGTGPSKYGYVNRIKKICGELYVCGYSRQVYRLQSDQWVHFDHQVIVDQHDGAIGFNDIDGAVPGFIVAVGWRGEIFWHDGNGWQQMNSPTTSNLWSVRCNDQGEFFACGDGGTIVRGSRRGCGVVHGGQATGNLWSVELHDQTPYFASTTGLFRLGTNGLERVETELGAGIDAFRLSSIGGALWSFGHERILHTRNGVQWSEAVCPDNA